MRLEAMAVEIPHVDEAPEPGAVRGRVDGGECGQRQGAGGSARAPGDADAGGGGEGVALAAGHGGGLPAGLGRARCAAQDRPADRGGCGGQRLVVRGYLYARDFPEVAKAIAAHAPETMGMSYELADARVEDMRAEVWKLTRVTFTGAAILLREKAAYRATSFRMAS